MRLKRWLVLSFSLVLACLAGYALLGLELRESPATELADKAKRLGSRVIDESNDVAERIDGASRDALRKLLEAADE